MQARPRAGLRNPLMVVEQAGEEISWMQKATSAETEALERLEHWGAAGMRDGENIWVWRSHGKRCKPGERAEEGAGAFLGRSVSPSGPARCTCPQT